MARAERTPRGSRGVVGSAGSSGRRGLPPRAVAALAGLACLGVGAYLYSGYRAEVRLREANRLGLQRHYAAAVAAARTITSAPAGARARAIVAYGDLAAGNLAGASRAFVEAVALNPQDWTLRSDWAVTLRRLGDRTRARHELQVALSLNPRLAFPAGFCAVSRSSGRRVGLC